MELIKLNDCCVTRLTEISIIVPAHNEEASLAPLVREARRCLSSSGADGEVVIVDDGSIDQTRAVAEQLCKEDAGVKLVRFEQKRGKTDALKAGFHLASGTVIAIVDADLQYDPTELPLLYAPILLEGYDLVNGYRVKRQDRLLRRLPSLVYNGLNRSIFHVETRDANSGLKAMRKEVFTSIEPFLRKDFHRYLVSIAGYLGYRILEVPISHRPRSTGRSKYSTPARLITGLLDMFRVRWSLRNFRNSVTES